MLDEISKPLLSGNGGEEGKGNKKYQKSYFDVLGLCCPSEVVIIERILVPLEGIQKVSVIIPSRTVIVLHDSFIISAPQIVKALNQARLEASIRTFGGDNIINKWPSPYIIACFILLLISLFKIFYDPLIWFALAATIVGLPPLLLRSLMAVQRCSLDINILMVIAVGGAVALKNFTEAGFIVFLFTTAEWLETKASHMATVGMTSLMSMAPQKAVIAETGEVVRVEEVEVNTVISVKAGEVIPIDGAVIDGRGDVDEKSLTGESIPVTKQAGSNVWAGTLNIDGYIRVITTAKAENSAVARMVRLVEEAQNNRTSTQRLIDTCAKYYTPVVVVLSSGVVILPLITKVQDPKHWFKLALVLLVSACPCALVLSTPITTLCALLKAAQTGLLVKGGDVLEALAKVKVAAFDKTGTITRGEFVVREFKCVSSEITFGSLLYWVSSVESKSSHPMAAALVEYANSKSVEPKPDDVSEFNIYPGEGIYGKIDGKEIYVGNRRIFARASSYSVPSMEGIEGVTMGYVICGKDLVGVFTLSDSCRTGSKQAISELKSLGIKSIMLTGDSTASAMYTQNQLDNSLQEIHSELFPSDKVRIITNLKSQVGPTLMIGDGINDAPALASADVSISMGVSGSSVANETSHISLMSNDIRKIPYAVKLARRSQNTVLFNIVFSVLTKGGVVFLAFAGHPVLWAAVLADVGTCLVVILNSMRLLGDGSKKAEKKKKCEKVVSRTSCDGGSCCAEKRREKERGDGCKENCCDKIKSEKVNASEKSCCGEEAKEKVNASKKSCCAEKAKEKAVNKCKESCCGEKVEEEVNTSKASCCAEKAKEKVNVCKKSCCAENAKEKFNIGKESCCASSPCTSVQEKNVETKCKDETMEKANTSQEEHKIYISSCQEEIKECKCNHDACSARLEIMETRETGGCGTGCCGGKSVVKLPEIIVE
ncbi:hypothetical protein LUZ60_017660 [Juncus effusus]|nr:hypothetical protein LUZ60_017660 [Juncus effusus]